MDSTGSNRGGSETSPGSPAAQPTGRESLARLRALLSVPRPLSQWSEEDLLALPRLYRHACTRLARLEREADNPRLAQELRGLVAVAHGLLMRDEERHLEPWPQRLAHTLMVVSPRSIRAEWRLLSFSFCLLYGLAAAAWFGVSRDLDLAFSLMAPQVVEAEVEQLSELAAGESFRGNFSFGLGESPVTAGWIMLNNIGVGILFFASALLPPVYLYLLGTNALMLGTYTAVAGHWGQAGSISSILWTHGVLEIQALLLVGTAGLVLVRAWVKPGTLTRGHAMVKESRRALELFTPVIPLLVAAGVIEGFISPHAPLGIRLFVAVTTGVGLIAWVGLGGRKVARPNQP